MCYVFLWLCSFRTLYNLVNCALRFMKAINLCPPRSATLIFEELNNRKWIYNVVMLCLLLTNVNCGWKY